MRVPIAPRSLLRLRRGGAPRAAMHHAVHRRLGLHEDRGTVAASSGPARGFGSSSSSASEGTAAYYDNADHYDVLWGKDNIHIGYYPHLADRMAIPLDFPQAAAALTRRIISLGDINHTSRVLDLGCGKGSACRRHHCHLLPLNSAHRHVDTVAAQSAAPRPAADGVDNVPPLWVRRASVRADRGADRRALHRRRPEPGEHRPGQRPRRRPAGLAGGESSVTLQAPPHRYY